MGEFTEEKVRVSLSFSSSMSFVKQTRKSLFRLITRKILLEGKRSTYFGIDSVDST